MEAISTTRLPPLKPLDPLNPHLPAAAIPTASDGSAISEQLRLEIELLEPSPAQPARLPAKTTAPVLIVDDDADMCRYVERCLKAIGFTSGAADLAADGLEALEKLALRKAHLIISDVMMPRMDGLALCERLDADADLRDIPVLFMTGELAIDDLRQRLPPRTRFDVLAKPFSARMLRDALDRLGLSSSPT